MPLHKQEGDQLRATSYDQPQGDEAMNDGDDNEVFEDFEVDITEHLEIKVEEDIDDYANVNDPSFRDFLGEEPVKQVSTEELEEYMCYICGASSLTLSGITSHQKDVHQTCNELMFGEPRNKCPMCGQGLDYSIERFHACTVSVEPSPDVLVKRLAPSTNTQMCYKCGLTASTLTKIKSHQRQVHGSTYFRSYGKPRDFQCLKCRNMFESSAKLAVHVCRFYNKQGKVNGTYSCGQCGASLKSELAYDLHVSTVHSDERRFQCKLCEYKGKTSAAMRQHVRKVHEQTLMHTCEECGQAFRKPATLESHKAKFHSADKTHVCDKCGASFCAAEYLKKHCKRQHPQYYMCTLCEKVFTEAKKLCKHLFTVHQLLNNIDVMVCPVCSTQFSSVEDLDKHNASEHKAEMSSVCNRCNFASTSRVILKLHLLNDHVGKATEDEKKEILEEVFKISQTGTIVPKAKPDGGYPCQICGRVLSQKSLLVMHTRQVHEKDTHTFRCEHCDFTTYQSHILRRHFKEKHDKSQRFQCEECPAFFHTKSGLRTHIKKVHKKFKRYRCDQCDRAYHDIELYRRHALNEHS